MPRCLSHAAWLAIALLFVVAPAYAGEDANPIRESDVLAYLDQLVAWQRDAVTTEPATKNAREMIFRDSLREDATKVLESGFAFARSEAGTVTDDDDAPGNADTQDPAEKARQHVAKRAADTDKLVIALRNKIATLHGNAAQRSALQGQLKLALAKQELLKTVLANIIAATSEGSASFLGKINNLARSIPELNPALKKANATAAASPATDTGNMSAAGATSILSLASDIYDITRTQHQLQDLITKTDKLSTASRELIKPLRAALDNDSATQQDTRGAALSIDQRVAAYKQLASNLIPLGEATMWAGTSKRALLDWQDVLTDELHVLLRQLGIRVAVLLVTLAIPLVISLFAARAINKYVADSKRKHQMNMARRIVTGVVIVFILLFNFISDFGSFATFAGFMTAGLAVALQGVLMSLVAHFLFYGRFGVRSGDRVNVAGVTGDIVQIGMVRFYLRELKETDGGLEPTGKIVAFPNSILFQPSAFYKYE